MDAEERRGTTAAPASAASQGDAATATENMPKDRFKPSGSTIMEESVFQTPSNEEEPSLVRVDQPVPNTEPRPRTQSEPSSSKHSHRFESHVLCLHVYSNALGFDFSDKDDVYRVDQIKEWADPEDDDEECGGGDGDARVLDGREGGLSLDGGRNRRLFLA